MSALDELVKTVKNLEWDDDQCVWKKKGEKEKEEIQEIADLMFYVFGRTGSPFDRYTTMATNLLRTREAHEIQEMLLQYKETKEKLKKTQEWFWYWAKKGEEE